MVCRWFWNEMFIEQRSTYLWPCHVGQYWLHSKPRYFVPLCMGHVTTHFYTIIAMWMQYDRPICNIKYYCTWFETERLRDRERLSPSKHCFISRGTPAFNTSIVGGFLKSPCSPKENTDRPKGCKQIKFLLWKPLWRFLFLHHCGMKWYYRLRKWVLHQLTGS